ncbi:MAG: hypothetical protein CMF52_03625 [Legionellales bacterium]|nr:hypothetical protein [Legionellales bacterium]|tara:strand:+ start:22 stop:294 length:273 start_codon:yes stop_codon:yes gene_type:complete
MMSEQLLQTLVAKKLVHENTLVYANVRSKGLGGKDIFVKKDVYYYPGMPAGAIYDIEGMTPERFAKAYNIKPDGTFKEYKKRGRKPKTEA